MGYFLLEHVNEWDISYWNILTEWDISYWIILTEWDISYWEILAEWGYIYLAGTFSPIGMFLTDDAELLHRNGESGIPDRNVKAEKPRADRRGEPGTRFHPLYSRFHPLY